jgi:catalase
MPSNSRSNRLTQAEMADARVLRGKGGETHQVANGDVPVLTT